MCFKFVKSGEKLIITQREIFFINKESENLSHNDDVSAAMMMMVIRCEAF